jgi:glycosyltransferase involved in cell wall biosynthesis
VVEDVRCGLCVDPLSPEKLADAIQWICENPSEAHDMGVRGKEAIVNTYNWEKEGAKLIDFYESIMSDVAFKANC